MENDYDDDDRDGVVASQVGARCAIAAVLCGGRGDCGQRRGGLVGHWRRDNDDVMGQEQDWDRRDDRKFVSGKLHMFAGPVVGDVTWDEGRFA